MRIEINKKRGRPSERSEEARAKGAKRGKSRWVVGGGGASMGCRAFLRFIIVKNAIFLQKMQDIPDIDI